MYAETAGGGNLSRWFAKDQSTSGGWIGFIETGTGGTVSLAFFRSFESNFGWWRVSNAMSVNAWHNIVITYNSNSTANVPTFYLDGVQLATPTTVFSASGRVTDDSPNSLYVGNNNLNTRNWDGRIGVVQLYNRILTAVEINNNFKALRHRYGV